MLYRISAGIEYTKTGNHITPDQATAVIREAQRQLVEVYEFRGVGVTRCEGAYRHDDGHVVYEQGVTFEVYCDEPFNQREGVDDYTRLKSFAQWLRNTLNQECVLFARIDTVWHFV